MPKLKTYKTLSKRIRVTKNGKVIRRSKSQDHFNAGETGKAKRNKRRDIKVSKVYLKNISKL
jgi:large subunit ribosomal protein L35